MICIVTVYKSFNLGSFLQAKALRDALLCHDKTVVFLDAGFRPWIYKRQATLLLRLLLKLKWQRFGHLFLLIWKNFRRWKSLPSISRKSLAKQNNVTFILGSDEIWNVERPECRNELFWGVGLQGRVCSYSPSVNNATSDELRQVEYVETALAQMKAVSVRDSYSQSVISKLTSRLVMVTLDPTLLFGPDYYLCGVAPTLPYPYIAVYAFQDTLQDQDRDNVVRYAREKQLPLVSISGSISWCDEDKSAAGGNPFLYYANAALVVTNTFHGTAFAINFEKPMVNLASHNRKIEELLDQFSLSNSIATGLTYSRFCELADHATHGSSTVKPQLEKLRLSSRDYIARAVGKTK